MTDNERLSRELRDRADQAGGHPISFDDVKRSARKMKWQQRAAAGGVAAVVLAIAVPVGLSVANNNDTTSPPVANPSPTIATPSPTATTTPSPEGDGKVELTLDAPAGAAARTSWLDGKTLHLAGGETVELPKAYSDVVSYHGGFLGATVADYSVDEIRNGNVVSSHPGSGFAVSADGTLVSWFEQSPDGPGQLKIGIASGMGDGEQSVEIPQGLKATPMTFRGSDVVYQTDNQNSGERKVWYTDGDRSHEIKGATGIGGYSSTTDKAAVQTKVTDEGSCWSTYGFPGGEYAGGFDNQTCAFSLGEFSTDGKYVIGWPAYYDGWGPGEVSLLDAETFKPVAQFDSGKDYGVSDAVWEGDSNSLLASVYLDGTWQLLRLGVDGSIETASGPVEADDLPNPFQLVDVR
jgi:hypothetical protein